MQAIAPEELGRLYREHAPALRLFVRQWPAADEDIVHDCFLQLARQMPSPQHILPWLYRVVRRQVLATYRSQARRRRREEQTHRPESWFDRTDQRMDGALAALHLRALSLELSEVLVARIWGGLTFEEIAELVGCSLPTAHRRYQTALAGLRERMTEKYANQST